MVVFKILSYREVDESQTESKLLETLNTNLNKFQQIKDLKKEDIAKGGRYHKSYKNFMMDFCESVMNYAWYHITDGCVFWSNEEMNDCVNKQTQIILPQLMFYAKDNDLISIDKEIIGFKNKFLEEAYMVKIRRELEN